MAKVTRSVLKDLVKECLVEILTEGLANSEMLVESPSPRAKSSSRGVPKASPRPARQHPTNFMEVNTNKKMNEQVQDRIESVAGGNDVMRDILADTAARTLPNMVAADKPETAGMAQRMTRGDPATKAMAGVDPMDLFEGASNWATLAFAGAKAPINS